MFGTVAMRRQREEVYVSGTFAPHNGLVLEVQYSNRVLAINTRMRVIVVLCRRLTLMYSRESF